MIQLLKNIKGNFVTEIKGVVNYIGTIEAEIQQEDYVNIYGFTAFLQNFSQIPKTESFAIPNLFGYTTPIGINTQTVDFNTCNRTARWYNMQESPEYLMGLLCGVYFGPTTVVFTIDSFIVNGIEYVNTPLSSSVNALTANWVPANNDIVYSCTTGNATGLTYTDFVDFLNYTFNSNNLNYEARVSYESISLTGSNSVSGFYIIYPENDVFRLSTSSDSGIPMPMTYTNDGIDSAYIAFGYYQSTLENFNYNCETNTITE